MPFPGRTGPFRSEEKSICTLCGKEADALTWVTDEDHVCDECLEENYEQCDLCGEYYDISMTEFYDTDDGHVCEYCYEDDEDGET